MSTVFKDQYESSPLQGANATYVEWLYEQYLAEPGSVPPEWRQYFGSLGAAGAEVAHGARIAVTVQTGAGCRGGRSFRAVSPLAAAAGGARERATHRWTGTSRTYCSSRSPSCC